MDNPMQHDPLRDLIRETLAFYARFDLRLHLPPALEKFQEEAGELVEAASQGSSADHIAEEAADVLVTLVGVLHAAGIPPEQWIEQVYAVIEKNRAKTQATHIVQDGKIARRSDSRSAKQHPPKD